MVILWGRMSKRRVVVGALGCCLSVERCGEVELRTPKYENQKSRFFLCLEFRFREQNGGIQPEKSNTENRPKKSLHYQPLIFSDGEGGIILLLFPQPSCFLSLHS